MLAGLLLFPGAPWAAETIGYDQIVVVTVAIGQQPGWDALPNAARDVQLFHEALAGPSDAPIHIIHLDDATATREGILEALDQAATEAGKRDRSLLIFYFAGHGETYKNQGYIVPVGGRKDAFSTWLSVDALKTASKAAPVRHQLFILGSCFGGALIQRGRDLSVAELRKQELAATWRAGELGRVAHVALAAGNERQKIPDGTPGEGSAFGRAVATALRATAKGRAADYNSDGCVDRYELAAYVSAHGRTSANSPRIGPLPEDDAGILALCQGRYDTPPRVTPWGPTRGGWTAGQEVAPETPTRPALVHIPPGSFNMGSPMNEPSRMSGERLHNVVLAGSVAMMRSEVTQGQWTELMRSNPSHFKDCGVSCPVESVSWLDATAFANALSRHEGLTECYGGLRCKGRDLQCEGGACSGKDFACDRPTVPGCNGYRLPTEAEWEYAARAGTATPWYDEPKAVAWYRELGGTSPQPVGRKRANAWGLHDMLGNVLEWTGDWDHEYDPQDEVGPRGPPTARVVRGGSWSTPVGMTRAATRLKRDPTSRHPDLGFRLCRSL
ncbi:MAG: SUMF1/EgtB/PvdO family nonheme iron enzyme [bacterium]